jgi:hypothetical protein
LKRTKANIFLLLSGVCHLAAGQHQLLCIDVCILCLQLYFAFFVVCFEAGYPKTETFAESWMGTQAGFSLCVTVTQDEVIKQQQ